MLISIQSVPSDFHLGDKRAFLILGAGGVSRCQSSINLANTKFFGKSSFASPLAFSSTGLHKLCYPTIRDRSTWSKFGAHGEHGDVFLFSNFGAL